jgi:hypothetical protein
MGLDGLKRGISPDPVIGKEFQHLAGLLQVLIALDVVGIHLFLGGALGLISEPSDVVNQAVDQVVVQPLIAVVDKTEQVDFNNPLV